MVARLGWATDPPDRPGAGLPPQTVRDHLHAFNERGVEGRGMKPGSGRKPRLAEEECGVILALVKLPPPGKPVDILAGELAAPDPEGEPEWTLDTLTAAAKPSPMSRWRCCRHRLCHPPRHHLATTQLNCHATPWAWGSPAPPHRMLRRCFVCHL